MAWCFSDVGTHKTAELQARLISEAAFVPTFWSIEVANLLALAHERQRISYSDATEFLRLLSELSFEVDSRPLSELLEKVFPLARAHRLTSYDAAYLELALRRHLPLATLKSELRAVANSLGIELLGI